MNAMTPIKAARGIVYHRDLVQGSTEWLEARTGILTASEMKHILTPTLKVAANDKERAHLYRLLGQRITGYTEVAWQGDDMLRGHEDEIAARMAYQANYAPVEDCGFITNDKWGFTIGYSPDGLVDADGLIEAKSRLHKFQVETILENVANDTAPAEFMIQLQTGLLVSERKWVDFISYSAGLPMATVRVFPDPAIQEAIVAAATAFEERLSKRFDEFIAVLKSGRRFLQTERAEEREIHL